MMINFSFYEFLVVVDGISASDLFQASALSKGYTLRFHIIGGGRNSRGAWKLQYVLITGGGIWLKHQHELIGTGSVPC